MIQVDDKEIIRRAYLLENKSQRQIANELHHSRHTIVAALADPSAGSYQLRQPRPAPGLAPYQSIIEQRLREDLAAPRKQRRPAHRIFTQLVEQRHFPGAESTVRRLCAPVPHQTGAIRSISALDDKFGISVLDGRVWQSAIDWHLVGSHHASLSRR